MATDNFQGFLGDPVRAGPAPAEDHLRREREQLLSALERYRLLAEHARDIVLFVRPDGRILEANEAAVTAYGYAHDELVRMKVFDLRAPGTLSQVTDQMVLADRRGITFETVHRRRDGRPFPVEVSSRGADVGGERLLLSIVRDITDRKRAEEALRESEERFRTLINLVPQLIWSNDPNGATRFYNDRWMEYTGTDMAAGLEMRWKGLIHPDDLPLLQGIRRRGIEAGEPYEAEYRIRHRSGEYRWHICRVVPFRNAEGEITAWFGTGTDVHDLKQAETALQEADRRKDEFLATLAHELRNPLAPVRNAVEILRVKAPADPGLEWARDVIDRQVQQLTRLVDDLLDVSRITRGKIELRRERIDLAAIVDRALETSRPLIEASRHRLTVSYPEGPLLVAVDLTRMAQVLANLLNNAAKYTRQGGRIELSTRRDGDEAVVEVRDDGIGILPEMLSRIFEMFAQVDTSLERAQGGLGIGLTIAQRLVEMHGGTIAVASEGLGKGSAFTIRLPLAPAQGAAEPGEEGREGGEAAAPKSGLRILVADDNEDSVESLAMLLKLQGHDVRAAHDGPEALAAAAEQRPDLVLLDIGMPGMSGYEVAARMRGRPETRDAVLVAATGWGQEEDRRRSREAGFDHHFVKPLDPKALDELIARMTSRETRTK